MSHGMRGRPFDRLLLEQLPRQKVMLAVRSCPIINDALREDAVAAALRDLVETVDGGCDAPRHHAGRMLARFRERCVAEDLIIAKGQGNCDTLDELADKRIVFLRMVKCPRVSQALGQPGRTFVARCNQVAQRTGG